MVKLHVTTREGDKRELEESVSGQSLMEVCRDNDIEMEALCGGCCSCATCHIVVDAAWASKVPPRTDDEFELVSSTENYEDNSRLACQIPLTEELDGIAFRVMPEE